ncbi:hypothetical protein K2173_019115 [Erythroxylum novogranatense]|uniref:Glycosyltransferase n=1 Tax=Erythroxylum novogranatense TaxID=1862640 RepID=A0AAV8SSP0_9ROSI|nr:hypothetical protein K2173_019115 [Erythroxylum novogranatense]
MPKPHILLIAYPAQGHINPALQFSKRLIRIGASVTLATSVFAHRRFGKTSFPDDLSLAFYSDGYDDGYINGTDPDEYRSETKRRGLQALNDIIVGSANEGKPVTCLVYTLLLTWASEVARTHHLPSFVLWIQPATVLDIYYYFFNGYADLFNNCNDMSYALELPGLRPLIARDLPSFLIPSNAYPFAITAFQEQIEMLSEETKPMILVNTFDALEPEGLKAVENFDMIAIGPLIPSAFLDGEDPSDSSFGCDLFQGSEDYIQWLNSKPNLSVVYVSFGTIAVICKRQMEEVARGLLDSGHPFLWVIKEELKGKENKGEEKAEEDQLSCREELEQQGKIVRWCSQLEVLNHPSVGCFVTHCGWNSTLESMASGVPVVAFPQWSDQGTNAKLTEDVWKTGVRVVANEEGIVEAGEIRRCFDLVMDGGEISEEMRKNSKKWKDLAREAVVDGGSSDRNLKGFVNKELASAVSFVSS